jgi:sugar phosphate permease
MVAVAALAMVATLPGRTHGLGMVTERVLADPHIGLDRTAYGHLNLWATLIGALFCLGIGRLIDRLGSRIVLTAVLALLAAAVFGMSLAGSAASFFIAVTLTRGFGQSALSVVSIALVGKWFRKRLGFAMGIYTVLMALGFMAAYQGGQAMKDADWRIFWMRIGCALLVFTPIAWLITRDTPESCGLEADDSETSSEPMTATDRTAAPFFTLREALKTPAFWFFALGTSAFGLVSAGVALFNESIFVDLGFDKSLYYAMLKFGVPFGLASNVLTGWLANRVPLGKLAAVALLVMAAALGLLPRLHSQGEVQIYTAVYAAAGGAMTVLFFTVWGRLYGRAHLGRIQAAAQMLTVIASAVGPLAFAATKESSGSYTPALWTSAAAIGILGIAAWLIPLPSARLAMSDAPLPEPQPA